MPHLPLLAWLRFAGFFVLALEAARGGSLVEDFREDPIPRGWRVAGESSLFHWDAAAQNLQATWDSSRDNGLFYWSLGQGLSRRDDFECEFDLWLESVQVGLSPAQPFTFELAVGFLNLAQATAPGFLRGTGVEARNLVEFDYFPDSGFGATVSPTLISAEGRFAVVFSFPVDIENGVWHSVRMQYVADKETLVTTVTRAGDPVAAIKEVRLAAFPAFDDFQVDAFSITSYSAAKAGGSILASGRVDNLKLRWPDPPRPELQGRLVDGLWQVEFLGDAGFTYRLERSADCRHWEPLAEVQAVASGPLRLSDPAPLAAVAFYRVSVRRP